MPHSVSSEEAASLDQHSQSPGVTNAQLPTIEPRAGPTIDETEVSDVVDQDMAMEGTGLHDAGVPELAMNVEMKSEVKLEDLFADVESDEEFPSANGHNLNVSSSPETLGSPL